MPKAIMLPKAPLTNTFVNSLQRQLSLEIELSNYGSFSAATHKLSDGRGIAAVHDGSIIGNAPAELIIPPTSGDQFIKEIMALAKALDTSDCQVNETCGLHVHVNARDFSPYDLRRFLQVYSIVEKEIFIYLLSPERSHNRFCALMTRRYEDKLLRQELPGIVEGFLLPQDHQGGRIDSVWLHQLMSLQDKREIQSMILHWLYFADTTAPWEDLKGSIPERRAHKYESKRYAAVNLHSWQERGTIEWRQCEGTLDPMKLIMWPLFCGWVVEMSSILTDIEVKRISNLKDLVTLEWSRPLGGIRRIPHPVRDWVLSYLNLG